MAMKVTVTKEFEEVRYLTVLKKNGTGRLIFNMPNVRQFERDLTEVEVTHAQYLLASLTEGAASFGDTEPGDVLGEAVRSAGILEDQSAMILSLTSERDTAARAADNANAARGDTAKELEAVRKRLREVSQQAVDETTALRKQLDDANQKNTSLQGELADVSKRMSDAERLLEAATNPAAGAGHGSVASTPATSPDAPKPSTP